MTERKYYEVKISCSKSVCESISFFLVENGALGAVEENVFVRGSAPKDTPTKWVRGYFHKKEDFLKIKEALKSFLDGLKRNFEDFAKYRIISKSLQDKNWREEYKKHFKPIKVSKRIIVKPDYEKYAPQPWEKVVIINPQMAFGIGNHPTTKMCIKYIDELLASYDNVSAVNMLDVGAGSGILAIVAAVLGVKSARAFDIDDVAVEIAKENADKNNVSKCVKLGCYGIEKVKGEYQIIAANILASALIEMRDELIRVAKTGGDIILSGILKEQADEVIASFSSYKSEGVRMKLISTKKEKEWTALHFKKCAR